MPQLNSVRADTAGETSSSGTYARRIGLFSGTMMVVGGIIGSGIFLNPALVAERARTVELTLGVWVLGGGIALIGALVFAELGARRPVAGGGYVYLRDAYGQLPAFLYAWTLLLVIATGAIAAVAVTFASLYHRPARPGTGCTVAARRWRDTAAVGGQLSRSQARRGHPECVHRPEAGCAGNSDRGRSHRSLRQRPPAEQLEPLARGGLLLAVGAALVPVLFAFGGWQQTNFVAEELIEPERNLPRALVAGVIIVVAVYLLANLAYLRTLGLAGLAGSSAPAADAMDALLGPPGRRLIAAGIAISTFGFLNLVILVSPRVYQAMARDGLFFPSLARLHPSYRTPSAAILFQGAWAIILTADRALRRSAGLRGVRRLDLFRGGDVDRVRLPGPGTNRPGALCDSVSNARIPPGATGLHAGGAVRRGRIDRLQPRQRREGNRAHDAGRAGVSVLGGEAGQRGGGAVKDARGQAACPPIRLPADPLTR